MILIKEPNDFYVFVFVALKETKQHIKKKNGIEDEMACSQQENNEMCLCLRETIICDHFYSAVCMERGKMKLTKIKKTMHNIRDLLCI